LRRCRAEDSSKLALSEPEGLLVEANSLDSRSNRQAVQSRVSQTPLASRPATGPSWRGCPESANRYWRSLQGDIGPARVRGSNKCVAYLVAQTRQNRHAPPLHHSPLERTSCLRAHTRLRHRCGEDEVEQSSEAAQVVRQHPSTPRSRSSRRPNRLNFRTAEEQCDENSWPHRVRRSALLRRLLRPIRQGSEEGIGRGRGINLSG